MTTATQPGIEPGYIYIYISWPSGLAVTICNNRAARRWHRKFKSSCTPIFLYVFSADPQRLFLLIYIYIYIYIFKILRKASVRAKTRTSSDDSRVDRIKRAWSSSSSHIFFGGWCNVLMDSAHDFDLLGESVPQVRVSAPTLALLGFFQLFIYIYIHIYIYTMVACVYIPWWPVYIYTMVACIYIYIL